MAPTNKAQASGVSSGSFLELRAQVAKQKESLTKGNANAVVKKNKKVRHSSATGFYTSRVVISPLIGDKQMVTPKQRR